MKLLAVQIFLIGSLLLPLLLSCTSTAEAVQNDFRTVTRQVLPSIVKIDVVEIVKDQSAKGRDGKPLFDYFFDDPEVPRPDQEYRQESLGSGILVRHQDDRYYALTNAHVTAEAQDITVTLDDGRVFPASLVGKDERKDLALVLFTTKETDIPIVSLGDSDALQVGDIVLAMGAPYGFQSTVTSGIISALHRRGGPGGNINDFIQTDASINKGNSGGALVDVHGKVIGINTWISSQSGDSVGLGFSIPINNAKHAISDFISAGKIQYGWLGVSVVSLDRDTAISLGQDFEKGALVTSLYDTSPAQLSGIKPGDIVIAINRKVIASAEDLIQVVGDLTVNDKPELTIKRHDKILKISPVIALREEDDNLAKQSLVLWPGFSLYPLTEQVRKDLDITAVTAGIIVRQVVPQSPGAHAGLKNRDVILNVNNSPVTTLRQFYDLWSALDRTDPITIGIKRDGKEMTLEISNSPQRQKQAS